MRVTCGQVLMEPQAWMRQPRRKREVGREGPCPHFEKRCTPEQWPPIQSQDCKDIPGHEEPLPAEPWAGDLHKWEIWGGSAL